MMLDNFFFFASHLALKNHDLQFVMTPRDTSVPEGLKTPRGWGYGYLLGHCSDN